MADQRHRAERKAHAGEALRGRSCVREYKLEKNSYTFGEKHTTGSAKRGAVAPSLSNSTNSTKSEKHLENPSPYQCRARHSLACNIQREARLNTQKAAFLTLTLGDWRNGRFHHIKDKKEAARRWNSLRRHLIAWLGVKCMVSIWERHKKGGWHMHAFLVVGREIRHCYDFAAVRRGDYSSACKALRTYWGTLRKRLPRFGFGRHQLEPVQKPERAGNYLAKYLGKGIWGEPKNERGERPAPSGRCVSYCGDWVGRMYAVGWSWCGLGGVIHGCVVAALESALGGLVAVNTKLKERYGSKWCYYLRQWWVDWAEPLVVNAPSDESAVDRFWLALSLRPLCRWVDDDCKFWRLCLFQSRGGWGRGWCKLSASFKRGEGLERAYVRREDAKAWALQACKAARLRAYLQRER